MRRIFGLFVVVAGVACGGAATEAGGASAPKPASGGRGPVAILECGDHFTCAILKGGSLSCWGAGSQGQLGNGGGPDQPKPVKVEGISDAKHIGLASTYGCILGSDRAARCWGTGRSPDGRSLERARPQRIPNMQVNDVSGSGLLMCARLDSGKVHCWGTEKAPDPNLGGKPIDVQVASTHGCVMKDDGQVQCWDAERWANSGSDAMNRPVLPSPATGLGTGDAFACVIGKDKKIYCWGANDLGQLGKAPDYDAHEKPEAVPGITNAEWLAVGEASVCAILEGGAVTCWGSNASGELGLGRKSASELPTKATALPSVKDMCFGSGHACVQTNDDEMYCWGANAAGQLGDGTKVERLTPVKVAF